MSPDDAVGRIFHGVMVMPCSPVYICRIVAFFCSIYRVHRVTASVTATFPRCFPLRIGIDRVTTNEGQCLQAEISVSNTGKASFACRIAPQQKGITGPASATRCSRRLATDSEVRAPRHQIESTFVSDARCFIAAIIFLPFVGECRVVVRTFRYFSHA